MTARSPFGWIPMTCEPHPPQRELFPAPHVAEVGPAVPAARTNLTAFAFSGRSEIATSQTELFPAPHVSKADAIPS